ncbi:MAG TPA: ParB/RepB/Spo0J family partition protein [Elusimicrobiota bacterium]|nr:ParB/RepB/Spo0J family partition protein [Elusimicrobiota bacterium]
MHKALGRGLDALLQPLESGATPGSAGEAIQKIAVDKIRPNRYQPRTYFAQEALQELADSIKMHGLAQPVCVSPSAVPGEYELVAGERRWRASKLAGLQEIPCMIRTVTDRERYELSLVENLQREDLNPIEEAEALKKFIDEFHLTQEDLARALGRSRSAVANKLRLLDLCGEVRSAVREGGLSEGHARALLGINDAGRQAELAQRILREKLPVRDVEKIVADWQSALRDGRVKTPRHKSSEVKRIEEDIQRSLGRRVEVQSKGKKGWIRIAFYSLDDLQTLISQLQRIPKTVAAPSLPASGSVRKAHAPSKKARKGR